jgi:CHRD domain
MRTTLTTLAVAIVAFIADSAPAAVIHYITRMDGHQQAPPNDTLGSGTVYFDFDTASSQLTLVSGTYTNMAGTVFAAHIHLGGAGVNGSVVVQLSINGATRGTIAMNPVILSAPNAAALQSDGLYVNVHSLGYPNGEIRGQVRRIADVVIDSVINIDDLLGVINGWGPCAACGPITCPADVTGDCTVNIDDLLMVINNWG